MKGNGAYRLLLVEDNVDDAELICREFSRLPGRFKVECVSRLDRAIVLLETDEFDAVMLDLNLPDSSGLETLRRLREARPHVGVVVISGTSRDGLREAALEAGALDFVSKSDPPSALVARSALYVVEHGRVRDRQAQVEMLVADNPEALVVVDRDGIVRYVNDSAIELFGRPREEFVDQPFGFSVTDEEAPIVEIPDTHLKAEMHVSACEWSGAPASLAMLRDVTEREALNEQLQQSRKMEAIGLLAGGVAHDFNNLLTVINGYAAFGLGAVHEADPLREFFLEIGKAGERAASLTRQLLAFSRKQVLQPRVLDLNEVIASTEKMLRRIIGEDISLTTALSAGLWSVVADPGQMEQVLMNLALNARDAMPRGGRLAFSTTNARLDEAFAQAHVGCSSGPHVLVEVSDTGCGMSQAVIEHIFEPFFTTKALGSGTGLGLATVYGIVHQSGGNIWVDSEEGKGSSFKICLPVAQEEDVAASGIWRRPPLAAARGSETILLVEDEQTLRQLARRVLESSGYTVVTAGNGAAALVACAKHPGSIDLLLTDVVMPEMSGAELVDRIAEARPNLKVLYMSGYTGDAIERHGVRESRMNFLEKPFTPHVLLERVRSVLDAPEDEPVV